MMETPKDFFSFSTNHIQAQFCFPAYFLLYFFSVISWSHNSMDSLFVFQKHRRECRCTGWINMGHCDTPHTLSLMLVTSQKLTIQIAIVGKKTHQSKRYFMELWYILYCTTANLREYSFCKHNDYYCTCIICCVHIVIAQSDEMHTKMLYQAKLISSKFQPVQHYKFAKCHSTIFWKKWN